MRNVKVGGQGPSEKMLLHVFQEVDKRPTSLFEPTGWREARAQELGINENSGLQRIVDATRKYPDVFARLPWVREKLLKEARGSKAKIRAWVRIVRAKVLQKPVNA